MTARILNISTRRPTSSRRENVLSKLDKLDLAFWIAFLVVVALIVAAWRSLPMVKRRARAAHGKPQLVEDDPDYVDPLGDLIGILS